MKYIVSIVCLFLVSLSFTAQAQPLEAVNSSVTGYNITYVSQANIGSSNDLGSETYEIQLENRAELMSNYTFVASNAQVGDIVVGGNAGIYEITAITFPTATVKLLNDPTDLPEPFYGFPQAPVPPIIIARPVGSIGLLPTYAFLGLGIDAKLVAVLDNYNKHQLANEVLTTATGGGWRETEPILRMPVAGDTVTFDWFYFTAPTLAFTIGGGSLFEVGTTNSITLSGTVDNPAGATLSGGFIERRLPNPDSTIHVFGDSTSYGLTISYTPKQGGTINYDALEYQFRASTSYSGGESGTVNSPTRTIRAVYPVLYGMSTTDLHAGGNPYTVLSDKLVATEGNKVVTFNGTNEFIYYAIPSVWGDTSLSSILDGNGFNVTPSFTSQTVSVTSTGLDNNWTLDYVVYKLNNLTTANNADYTFTR